MDLTKESLIAQYGAAYIRSLVAAEAAVRRGEFTAAKILRVAGYVQRTLAMRLLRLETDEPDTAILLQTALSELGELDAVTDGLSGASPETDMVLGQVARSRERAESLLLNAMESLETRGEVLDNPLPEILWVCLSCGAAIGNDRPNTCPVCDAIAAEFAWFGPFYVETPERLGRMSPAQIIATLETIPEEIAALVSSVSDAALSHKPSEGQWCVKETVGHLMETDRLFAKRVATLLERDDVPDLAAPGPPWKLHEGKGYETQPISEILAGFREARALSLSLVRDLTPAQWSRYGTLRNATTSLLDLGVWLANHDLGHAAQIRRLLVR